MNVNGLRINDVFNDGTTQEVNRHRHMARVDLAIDCTTTKHEFEVEGASKYGYRLWTENQCGIGNAVERTRL